MNGGKKIVEIENIECSFAQSMFLFNFVKYVCFKSVVILLLMSLVEKYLRKMEPIDFTKILQEGNFLAITCTFS